MTARMIRNPPPVGGAAWLELRQAGLGGPDVAAALGLSPYVSPFTLWHEKRGMLDPVPVSAPMEWGTRLEPVVCQAWADRHNAKLLPGGIWVDEWRRASLDRRIGRTGILEAKTCNGFDAWRWGPDGADDVAAVPIHVRIQTLWYGLLTGRHDLHVAVLIGGNDFRTYRVPWDAAEARDLERRARLFWLTVIDGPRPSLDDSASTYETVRELHPNIDGSERAVDPAIADTYLRADLDHKAADVAYRYARSRLLDAMGDARVALTPDGTPIARRQPAGRGAVALYPIHPKEKAA